MKLSPFSGLIGKYRFLKNGIPFGSECIADDNKRNVLHIDDKIIDLYLQYTEGDIFGEKGKNISEVEGNRIAICGEIYNIEELHAELGYPAVPNNVEFLSYVTGMLFVKFGIDFASKLNGNYCIAIWSNNALYLYVDRFGASFPIYYSNENGLLFSNKLRLLLNCNEIRGDIDQIGLALFLKYSYIPSPRTIIAGIKKLGPGEVLVYKNNKVSTTRYVSFEIPESSKHDEVSSWQSYLELLKNSVCQKMEGFSTDRVGYFLSGGLDSSANVALACRGGKKNFKTFGIGFEQEKFDERPYARLVADHFGIAYESYLFDGSDIEYLPEIVCSMDEPFMENGLFLTYAGFKAASNKVDLIIAGGAADQLYGTGGFAKGRPIAIRYLLDRLHCRGILDLFRRLFFHPPYHDNLLFKLKVMLDRAVDFNDWFFWGFDDKELQKLCKFQIRKEDLSCFSNMVPDYCKTFDDYYQYAITHQDFDHYVCQNVAVKSFRMAELFGIRLREPYLDKNVADYVLSLARRQKTKGELLDFLKGKRVTKYFHRQAMAGILPAETLKKPKQGGFVPMVLLLSEQKKRREIYDHLLNSSVIQQFCQTEYVKEAIDYCERSLTKKSYWYAYQDTMINKVMNLLVFSLWYQLHLKESEPSTAQVTLSQMLCKDG